MWKGILAWTGCSTIFLIFINIISSRFIRYRHCSCITITHNGLYPHQGRIWGSAKRVRTDPRGRRGNRWLDQRAITLKVVGRRGRCDRFEGGGATRTIDACLCTRGERDGGHAGVWGVRHGGRRCGRRKEEGASSSYLAHTLPALDTSTGRYVLS